WGHRGVIQAVADGLATAGAVDGYVWDSLKAQNPELVGKTRVVARSPSFGFPPFVQLRGREQSNQALGALFLSMAQDAAGQEILRELNLQGFVEGEDRLYDGIGELYRLYLESETDALQ
ncbi:MAG: PhnD/SsuA/transferrin family substrate-binding protein, partial [Anaerolineae bacterium]|nr:PhnD/SsuA/transferrin family substrate-binding protein [Anaerolineae bacterium]